jgi:hypothetical protein
MVDKILLSEICIVANNNIENEDEDYSLMLKVMVVRIGEKYLQPCL